MYWRVLDALLVVLDLEIDLGVDPGVQVVVGDDLLGLGVDHDLGDVDLEHPVDDRDDPVEAGLGEALVFSQPLDQAAVGRPDDPDAAEKEKHDENGDDDDDICQDHISLLSDG